MLMYAYSEEGGAEMGSMRQKDEFMSDYTNKLQNEKVFINFATNERGTKEIIVQFILK